MREVLDTGKAELFMGSKKEITTKGFIMRGGEKISRDELPKEERLRLAAKWNSAAMDAAGYTPVKKLKKTADNEIG